MLRQCRWWTCLKVLAAACGDGARRPEEEGDIASQRCGHRVELGVCSPEAQQAIQSNQSRRRVAAATAKTRTGRDALRQLNRHNPCEPVAQDYLRGPVDEVPLVRRQFRIVASEPKARSAVARGEPQLVAQCRPDHPRPQRMKAGVIRRGDAQVEIDLGRRAKREHARDCRRL